MPSLTVKRARVVVYPINRVAYFDQLYRQVNSDSLCTCPSHVQIYMQLNPTESIEQHRKNTHNLLHAVYTVQMSRRRG